MIELLKRQRELTVRLNEYRYEYVTEVAAAIYDEGYRKVALPQK